MSGQHALTVDGAANTVDLRPSHPLLRPCPVNTTCDGCGRVLRKGWPIRPTNGDGGTEWMCPPCWWERAW